MLYRKLRRALAQKKKIEKSYNATFVALIPKKADVVEPKDFRSITPITGFLYK